MEASVIVCSTTRNRCTTWVDPWAATFLFVYCAPLQSYRINYHQYADDTQVYIAVSKADFQVELTQLETCAASVHAWLQMNGLLLNPKKSEVIQFTATRGRDRVEDVTSLQVSSAAIKPSLTIKSLGVTRDTKLSFDEQVTNVCRLCYATVTSEHCVTFVRHCLMMLLEPSSAVS